MTAQSLFLTHPVLINRVIGATGLLPELEGQNIEILLLKLRGRIVFPGWNFHVEGYYRCGCCHNMPPSHCNPSNNWL